VWCRRARSRCSKMGRRSPPPRTPHSWRGSSPTWILFLVGRNSPTPSVPPTLSEPSTTQETFVSSSAPLFCSLLPDPSSLVSCSLQLLQRSVALIQFTSMFYNLERMGNQLALRISDLYNCHKMAVEGLVPEHTVAWIDYENSTDGTEIWRVSNDPYKLLYIEDAGMCQIFICLFFFFFFSPFSHTGFCSGIHQVCPAVVLLHD